MKKTEEADIPVVLAVGINPPCPANLWEQTAFRPRLEEAARLLAKTSSCQGSQPTFPEKYHLVVANFFPWVTTRRLADCQTSVLEQTLMLACHGYRDPHAHIAEICKRLGADLRTIVFHGAGVVPMLGLEFLRKHASTLWKAPCRKPDIVFCDSLAAPLGEEISNAVHLCHQPR